MDERSRQPLIDLISAETKRGQLVQIIDGLLTDDDKRVLGEQAADKVTKSIVMMGSLAPEPATFDEADYNDLVGWKLYGDDMEEGVVTDEMVRILQISMEVGVVVSAPIEGRLMVPTEVRSVIRGIFGEKS